jgi:hypothetical protein
VYAGPDCAARSAMVTLSLSGARFLILFGREGSAMIRLRDRTDCVGLRRRIALAEAKCEPRGRTAPSISTKKDQPPRRKEHAFAPKALRREAEVLSRGIVGARRQHGLSNYRFQASAPERLGVDVEVP